MVRPTKILTDEYLAARGAAFDAKLFLDPSVADFLDGDEVLAAQAWLAFMAGSDWERKYRGRRYTDETTGTTPFIDQQA
jgi:hypothetical protein